MKREARRYFEDLFSKADGGNREAEEELLGTIPRLVTEEMDQELSREFSSEEIEKTIMEMPKDKAPGPDGFQVGFFQEYWEIVKQDMVEAIREFPKNGKILKEWQATFLALIPKKSNPKGIGDYRPISLCNVIYKFISKLLPNRLKQVLPKIISRNQEGFVKGRQILDGIIMVHEALHSINHRKEAGMIIKIDLSKAYDRVSWDFLDKVLQAFGFRERWRGWMKECISTTTFSVLVNGSSTEFFQSKRGLRQGDPLSPYLFIIMAEVLGRAIEKGKTQGEIQGIEAATGVEATTHHQFVDDTILLGKATRQEARAFKQILRRFEAATNQEVNMEKSSVFFVNTPEDRQAQISRILGC